MGEPNICKHILRTVGELMMGRKAQHVRTRGRPGDEQQRRCGPAHSLSSPRNEAPKSYGSERSPRNTDFAVCGHAAQSARVAGVT